MPKRLYIVLALAVLIGLRCRVPARTGPPAPAANATLADLKEFYREGETNVVTPPYVVHATVTASSSDGNYDGVLVLRDATGGLELSFSKSWALRSVRPGTPIALEAHGLTVGGFGGVVRLGSRRSDGRFAALPDTALDRRLTVVGRPVAPVPEDVAAYALGPRHYSRLVRVCGVQVANADTSGTFASELAARNVRLEDCAGSGFTLRTSAGAGFAKAPLPTGRGCVTGIASAYRGEVQLRVRSLADVALGGPRCARELGGASGSEATASASTPRDSLSADFDGVPTRQPFTDGGWTNAGQGTWETRAYDGNGYLQASAYDAATDTVDAWLVTPAIGTASAKTLTFRTAHAYYKHDGLQVLASANFAPGTSPRRANWRPLPATLADADTPDNEWVDSGPISLPVTSDTLYVAFRYRGAKGAGETTTFRLDKVSVRPH